MHTISNQGYYVTSKWQDQHTIAYIFVHLPQRLQSKGRRDYQSRRNRDLPVRQRYWKRLFVPGSVSVSKIKRQ